VRGVDEADIWTCPMVGFRIKGVEPSGLTTRKWTSYNEMNYTRQDAYDS
jgi:hypothetical protein